MAKSKETQVEETQVEGQEEAKLMISDINNALAIVDTGVERGAYKGSEISTVGRYRDHLVNVVNYQSKEDTEEAEAESSDGETDESPALTAQDIEVTLRLIDLAIERGAFKGAEATGVGKVRDVIAAVVSVFQKRAQEAQEAQEKEEAEA